MPFLDIGSMELFLVAVIALVVVGPRDLPRLLKGVVGYWNQIRGFANDMRRGIDTLAREVEDEVDPFAELRKQEGLRPGMSPQEITEHIMKNRAGGAGFDADEELGPPLPRRGDGEASAAPVDQPEPAPTNSEAAPAVEGEATHGQNPDR